MSIPGLMKPTTVSYPAGANSPATAAKAINDANNQKLQNINQMAAGSRRRRGGDGQVTVPVIKPLYPQQNGPGTDTTSQQANISKNSMQGSSWATNDSLASKMGGSKKGGNPNWSWPCSSGGKSSRRRATRRNNGRNKKRSRRHRR
jgi:hypothetical protein